MSEDTLFRPPTPISPRSVQSRSPQSRTLSDLLHELMAHGNLTQRELARELGVAANTVNRLLHGVSVPTEETLLLIARYAHLPITDVREIAGRSPGEAQHFTLPREADQLTYRQQAAVRELVWAMLDGNARRVTR